MHNGHFAWALCENDIPGVDVLCSDKNFTGEMLIIYLCIRGQGYTISKKDVFMVMFKDAWSLSCYPYTRSQILQYVSKLNELTLQKEYCKCS